MPCKPHPAPRHSQINMSTPPLEVSEAKALKLTPTNFPHLLAGLDVEATWAQEADRREAELDSGTAAAVSGPDAIARLRARLARR